MYNKSCSSCCVITYDKMSFNESCPPTVMSRQSNHLKRKENDPALFLKLSSIIFCLCELQEWIEMCLKMLGNGVTAISVNNARKKVWGSAYLYYVSKWNVDTSAERCVELLSVPDRSGHHCHTQTHGVQTSSAPAQTYQGCEGRYKATPQGCWRSKRRSLRAHKKRNWFELIASWIPD